MNINLLKKNIDYLYKRIVSYLLNLFNFYFIFQKRKEKKEKSNFKRRMIVKGFIENRVKIYRKQN